MHIETERLILRKFTMDDLDAYMTLVSNPDVMKFSLSGPIQENIKVKERLQRILDQYSQCGYGLFAVIKKATGEFVGGIGITNQEVDGVSQPELGYRILPKFWGQGLASEACQAVIQFAFKELKMKELISIIVPHNTRSLHVANRIGMTYIKNTVFHKIPVRIYNINHAIIRELQADDLDTISRTFTFPWSTYEATRKLWQLWFQEQQEGVRTVCVVQIESLFVGYGSLLRSSQYPVFRTEKVPEISALWIDQKYHRQGLATQLIEHLEALARKEGYQTAGLGVGLYNDYGPAQRLYYKIGYQPDGNGMTYKGEFVIPGSLYPADDDLLIWLKKPLEPALRFRPVQPAERSLVHAWLQLPHVAHWFYGQGLINTLHHLDQFLKGKASATYWLCLDADHPIAFLITSYVQKDDPYAKWCTGKAITLDLLIGDLKYLGKGFAVKMIHQFLYTQFPDVEEVLIDPEATNTRALHVYEKVGFKKLDEFIPSHSPNLHYMLKYNLK